MDWHAALTDLPSLVLTVVATAAIGWIGWLVRTGLRWIALAMARPVAGGIAYQYVATHPEQEPKQRRENAIARAEDYLRMSVPFHMTPDRLRAEVLGGLGRLLAVDPAVSIGLQASATQIPFWLRRPVDPPLEPEPPRPSWLERLSSMFKRPVPLPPRITPEQAIAMGIRARAEDTLILTSDQIVSDKG